MKIIAAFTAVLALSGILSPAPATAQIARSFVSPAGNDSANCTLSTPCRTFAAAYLLTNAGGEIAVLGTAGYGPLTINKAISIVNGGGFEAGITVPSGGTGITINASTNDAVSIRGLTIDGVGVGMIGIQLNGGKSLTVANCVIRHVSGAGIQFSPNATSYLSVSNSLVADNPVGIEVQPTGSGTVTALFSRVEVNNNSDLGILMDGTQSTGTVLGTVFDSVAANNSNDDFVAYTSSGHAPTTLTLFHSLALGSLGALDAAGPGATIRIANSMVTGAAAGWVIPGGVIQTYGDNYIDGNGANTGSLTLIGKQ